MTIEYTPVVVADDAPVTDIAAAVTTVEDLLVAEHARLTADGHVPTAEEVDYLSAIGDDLDRVRAAHTEAHEAETARDGRVADIMSRVGAREDEAPPAEAPAEPVAAVVTDQVPAEQDAPVVTDQAPADPAQVPAEPVAAGATPPRQPISFRGLGGRADTRPAPSSGTVPAGMRVVTDNALVRGWAGRPTDHDSTLALAELFHDLHPGRGVHRGGERSEIFGRVETVGHPHTITPGMGRDEVARVIAAAMDPRTGSADGRTSIAASAGWCAPPVRVWDIGDVDVRGTYLSLPTVTYPGRGGIEFPITPDVAVAIDGLYADISQYGFGYTEAQEIARSAAGTPKPCLTIPCPGWATATYDLDGICITGDVLQDKAWPEFVQWWIDLAMALHEKKRGMQRLAQVIRGSSTVAPLPAGFGLGAFDMILSAVELAVTDIRTRYGLVGGQSEYPIEVILPIGALAYIRQDLRRRRDFGTNDPSDADIQAYFGAMNVAPQFLTDWQVRGADQLGRATPAAAWPKQMDFLVYPAGTWGEIDEGVVSIGRTQSPELAKMNQFMALFTEDARAIFQRAYGSRRYTVPLSYGGKVGLESALAIGGDPVTPTAVTPGGAAGWADGNLVALPGGITPADTTP